MAMRIASTYGSQMRSLYQRFVDQRHRGGDLFGPVDLNEVFDFAHKNWLWAPQKQEIRKRFKRDMAQALREEYFTDESGRPVRRYHAAKAIEFEDGRKIQKYLWDDIKTADRKHMEVALQQRRQHIVGECFQLKTDVDYYNEHHPQESPFQLLLDFAKDVADREQPTEYSPADRDDD